MLARANETNINKDMINYKNRRSTATKTQEGAYQTQMYFNPGFIRVGLFHVFVFTDARVH